MKMRSHRDLDAWKKSMDLVDNVYKVTKSFPNEELYSLTNHLSQITRKGEGERKKIESFEDLETGKEWLASPEHGD
jgi:hypothetical protein